MERATRRVVLISVFGLVVGLPLASPAQAPGYSVVRSWPQGRAPHYGKNEVTGVATDSEGRVYVTSATPRPVLVFSREGRFLAGWGAGKLNEPHTVRIDPEGNLWITDFKLHQVLKFRPDGQLLLALGVRKQAQRDAGHFNGPTDVAFGPNGEVYISDGYGNSRVVRFTLDGRYLGEWGRPGSGPGEFHTPHSIAAAADGRVYVADRENSRVQVFTGEGQFIAQWPMADKPWGLFIKDGQLFVVSGDGDSLNIYDLDGRHLQQMGGRVPRQGFLGGRRRLPQRKRGRKPGQLAQPHMVCVDDQGALYTAELRGHRAQKFVKQ